MHRIISKRLQNAINLNMNQRGFVETDGTLANTIILDHYIRSRVEEGKEHNVVSLDVRKAFDTVSHHSILRALKRLGTDEGTIRYIHSTLSDNTTTISVGREKTRDIKVTRGVKQGDPVSPLLFNAVIDELLCLLNSGTLGGTVTPTASCTAMAFADDVIIMADKEVNVPLILQQVEKFFSARGMSINPSKCSSLSVAACGKRCVARSNSTFKINGKWIPAISGLSTFKYLGHQYNSQGIAKPSLVNLPKWLNAISKAPLKPDQKAQLVKDHVIPKLLYGLQNSKVTGKILREADRLIKHHIKRALHLHSHTPDQFLYAKVKDGGIGIMNLRNNIPRILLGRLTRLLNNTSDQLVAEVLQAPLAYRLMHRLHNLAGEIPLNNTGGNASPTEPRARALNRPATIHLVAPGSSINHLAGQEETTCAPST